MWSLRELPRARANEVLASLRDSFAAPVTGASAVPVQITGAASPVAPGAGLDSELLALLFGSTADATASNVNLLRDSVEKLRSALRKPGLPLLHLAQRAARDLATHDKALDEAARESFDRVLGALDPDALIKSTPRKKLTTESAYKAALFDAVTEKFGQLKMYHDKGRLVRDYRTAYKKHIQDEITKQVDSQS